jgi:hypothetical protein
MRTVRKTVSLGAALAGMVAFAFAAVAYACTSLATLNTSAPAGNPGSNVTVTGSGFASSQAAAPAAPGAPAAGAAAAAAPVVLHWDGVNGPVLGQAVADSGGNITATVAIPQDAAAGSHVIVATQQNARGQAVGGTPARTPFQVNGANGEAVAPQPPAADPTRAPASDGSGGFGIALGAIGVVLFAGGLVTFVLARRQDGRGAPARLGRR